MEEWFRNGRGLITDVKTCLTSKQTTRGHIFIVFLPNDWQMQSMAGDKSVSRAPYLSNYFANKTLFFFFFLKV